MSGTRRIIGRAAAPGACGSRAPWAPARRLAGHGAALGRAGARALALSAGLAAALAFGGAARAETLSDALIAAYRNSGLLEQNRALLRAADEDVAQAVAALRPVLNYAASASRRAADFERVVGTETVSGTTYDTVASLGLSADWLLYDFGRSRAAIDAAKEVVLATRQSLVSIEQEVLLNTVAAYMQVREATAILDLRRNNVRVIEQELRAARDRFELGEITRTDVSIAEARLAEARSATAAALGDLAAAREAYKFLTGAYPEDLAPPPEPPQIPDSIEAARAVAVRTHPEIQGGQRQVKAAEFRIVAARAAINPTLSGSAQLGVDREGLRSGSVGLSLSGPIYQGGRLSSAIRQAQARRDAQIGALHRTVDLVEQEVGDAWAALAVAVAALQSTDEQIRAAQVAFRGVSEEATLGARTTLDVLNAEQDLLDARGLRINALTQRYVAVYQVLAAMGLLTVDHLDLGIATYDPRAYYNAVNDAPAREVSPQGQRLDRVLNRLGRN